jgi:dipeptidyl aminopeptidase/acylaminoacyl peptidase
MKVSLFAHQPATLSLLLAAMLASLLAAAELPVGVIGKLEGRVAISVAFSPDGKLIATGGNFNIELWDVTSGKRLRELTGHESPVYSVAFSPDVKMLASGGGDRLVRLWEVATGNEITQMKGHGEEVRSVCFSPDGKQLVSGSGDKTVRFWDVATGKELWRIDEDKWVYSVAFSPTGKLLAIGSMNSQIHIYDITSGQVVRTLVGHKMLVYSLAFSADGRLLASGSHDNTVRLWDVVTDKQLCVMNELNAPAYHVAFSPDGRTLAAMSTDGEIALWEVVSQKHIRTLSGAKSLQRAAFAFSRDGKTIATAGGISTVLFWDRTGRKGAPRTVLSDRELASLRLDLAGSDAGKGDEAIWTLVAAPMQAVQSVSEWVKPAAFDDKRVAKLIANLDSEEFALREQASDELARWGKAAESALQRALENSPSLEVKQRAEALLEKLERSVASPEVCRQVRAVAVLEYINTRESRELLTRLAGGAEGDRRTQEAKGSMRRMGQK